uniref:Uncharacterized protein n=1 Tax=Amphimedon queenslandica TaxID=400682 RepID=A0A1X7UP63_AMPQE
MVSWPFVHIHPGHVTLYKPKRRARKRHRQSQHVARKLWVEQHKTCHTYGKETPKSSHKRKAKRDWKINNTKRGKL